MKKSKKLNYDTELTSLYDRYAKLVEEVEEKCLKKSRHFPAKEAIYETPSDYDPLALNMGQLVVHRISLRFSQSIKSILASSQLLSLPCSCECALRRCKCETSQLQYSERCARVLPFEHQVTQFELMVLKFETIRNDF